MSHESFKNCSKAKLINTWHSTFWFDSTFDGSQIAYSTWDILLLIIIIIHHVSCFTFNVSFSIICQYFIASSSRIRMTFPFMVEKFKAQTPNIACYKTIFGSNLHTNAQSSRSLITKLIKMNTRNFDCYFGILNLLQWEMGTGWLDNFRCETFLIRLQYA